MPEKSTNMIEKITIEDESVIEQIRSNLPVADSEKHGLLPSDLWMMKNISIPPGSSVTISPVKGLVLILNPNLGYGKPLVALVGDTEFDRVLGATYYSLEYSVANKVLTIKNNYSSDFIAKVVYQDLS